jgi:hypothetical protein
MTRVVPVPSVDAQYNVLIALISVLHALPEETEAIDILKQNHYRPGFLAILNSVMRPARADFSSANAEQFGRDRRSEARQARKACQRWEFA